jgi:hypothetical protein
VFKADKVEFLYLIKVLTMAQTGINVFVFETTIPVPRDEFSIVHV